MLVPGLQMGKQNLGYIVGTCAGNPGMCEINQVAAQLPKCFNLIGDSLLVR